MKREWLFAVVALLAAGCDSVGGQTGVQGTSSAGVAGAQGPAGVIEHWTSFRDFIFEFDRADLHPLDMNKVAEIAAYAKQNPSVQLGIDGTMDPRGTDARNQELSDRRIETVRDALIRAGVRTSRIRAGAFGDTALRRDRRVEVLLMSNK